MADPVIRIYHRDAAGYTEDAKLDMYLHEFGGIVPSIGDTIVNPGVIQGLDRDLAENREVWTVVQRVFNAQDLSGSYIVLVVESRPGENTDTFL